MTSPILVTKLFIPVARPNLVRRSRLIERLDGGLHTKLTLISAPAGFGKTTLLTEWLGHLSGDINSKSQTEKTEFIWLSLDEADNDLARFLTYLSAALDQIEQIDASDAIDMLQSPQPPPAETVLTPIINQAAAIPNQVVFVLDDYHQIEAQPVHGAIAFLLANLPPQMHLVIATREDPLLPLSRWRVRRQITELRAADLRFTSAEAAEFLNQAMCLNLSSQDIATLERRTEGWIAGLQLAAISMQSLQDTARFIQSFSGSNRLVLDYLIEEVLNQQPQDLQDFLLQTAILKRLNGSLCQAVTGQENSQATLEKIDRLNLFIIPLDEQRHWYRYHHLFAELLLQRLNASHPDLLPELHARAATWYQDNRELSEAIRHALAGEDVKTAAYLTEIGALDALERSDFGFILKSVEHIPEQALLSSPWLFVYHCWALFLTGHIDMGAPKLSDTDWLLDCCSDDLTQEQKMRGYIAGLKVQLYAWQRDLDNMLIHAQQVKAYLPNDHWIRAYCSMMVGTGYWDVGDLAAANQVFKEAFDIGVRIGNKRVAVTGSIYQGHTQELMGQLQNAVQVYQDGFQFAQQDGREMSVACYLHIDLARVLYELNDLAGADQHLSTGIQQSRLLGDDRIEKIGLNLLARLYLALVDFEKAVQSIQDAEQISQSPDIVYDMRGSEYPQVRLWLRQDKFDEIEAWLKQSEISGGSAADYKIKLTYTMHARALIALARLSPNRDQYLDQAYARLAEYWNMAEPQGWVGKMIEILGLQALIFDLQGEYAKALDRLQHALTLAEPEGFLRVFVDEGPPMARLLYKALSKGIAPEYVQRLLAAFPDTEPEPVSTTLKILTSEDEWVEPLSERELEVLQLIADGFTNQQIAARLYLSLNTIKAHTRNIYSKLGVNNRTQAGARARTLGLLKST
jgi:LuxR family maltose regulon positive regulatory protein